MDQVKLENSLAQHHCLFSLIKQCCLKVKEIENYEDLKLKAEITKYVANLVEEGLNNAPLSKKQKKKIDKKALVKEIIKTTFNLAETELNIIDDHIDYNLENKIVKKNTLVKQSFRLIKKWVLGG